MGKDKERRNELDLRCKGYIALLLLIKCYDKKMVLSSFFLLIVHLDRPRDGEPTKKIKKIKSLSSMCAFAERGTNGQTIGR